MNNTTGSNNTAAGVGAGSSLTTGDNNIDIGNSGVDGESDTIRIGSEFQTRTDLSLRINRNEGHKPKTRRKIIL